MALTETSTVGLNLSGDFAAQALKDYEAAVKLAEGMDQLAKASEKVKPPAIWTAADNIRVMEASAKAAVDRMHELERAAKKAEDALAKARAARRAASEARGGLEGADREAFGWMNRLPSALAAPPPTISGFQRLVGGIERALGPGAAQTFTKAAMGAVEFGEKNATALRIGGAALSAGGAVVAAGGLAIAAGAAALGIAAVKLGSAVVHLGIEQTSMRERLQNALGSAGAGMVIKVAAQYGLDTEEAKRQVGGLLSAKFGESEIPVILRIAAGIGEMRDQGKAQAFVEKMINARNAGAVANEEMVKGFKEAGINVDDIWATLAKRVGKSVKDTQAAVKAGKIKTSDVLGAVEEVGGKQFGGAADKLANSVPILAGRVKMAFMGLFAEMDLDPIKDFLKNVLGVLEGGAGGALKGSLKELFGSISHALLDPFRGEEGKKRLESMVLGAAALIKDLAGAIKTIAPLFELMADGLAGVGDFAQQAGEGVMWAKTALIAITAPISNMITPILTLMELFGGLGDGATSAGNAVGSSFADGVGAGLLGAGFDAASSWAAGFIAQVKAGLGIASPSKEAMAIMGHFGDGMTVGAANDTSAAEAGAKMAAGVSAGAAGGLAGGAGGAPGGAAGAGGGVVINVIVPPGSTAETQAAAKAGAEEGLRQWQRYQRADARERGERAA